MPAVHVVPLAWQVPPSGDGIWQTDPVSAEDWHTPSQQVPPSAAPQAKPSGMQDGAVQCPTPLGSGKQGSPLQHWLPNSHWASTAMQQPGWPV